MSKIDPSGVKKTLYYLRRNGFKNTCYAVRERLNERKMLPYVWEPLDQEELARQRQECARKGASLTFSIVVPCYRTGEQYLRALIDSVGSQTYSNWELILADATEDDSVEKIISTFTDSRIRYFRLSENGGIAENTNRALERASGDYVGLLDHDDLLTEDALYEMWKTIEVGTAQGEAPALLYSDEDKCNGDATEFFEPNMKEDFNLDLLLSNNYICHFMVMERELIQALLLRREFEGAQDYDLILRAVARLEGQNHRIVHVPKVLYHWRCHVSSTAENPQSKLYAYDAGRRSIQSFAEGKGWQVEVVDTEHLGFYRIQYTGDPLKIRQDIGAVGGPLIYRGRICGGRLADDGRVFYAGLNHHFSGYLHRAVLHQDAEALDIRNIRVREDAHDLFQEVVGVPWKPLPGQEIFDISTLPEETDIASVSLALGRALRKAGYRLLYLPEYKRVLKNEKSNSCYSEL